MRATLFSQQKKIAQIVGDHTSISTLDSNDIKHGSSSRHDLQHETCTQFVEHTFSKDFSCANAKSN